MRTAVGDSEEIETAESLGQGSSEGAILSTNSISKGIDDFFLSSEYEVSYGPIPLIPFQFFDDISRLTFNPTSAQMGNNRMENLVETKLL